jgi:hypothetical protein
MDDADLMPLGDHLADLLKLKDRAISDCLARLRELEHTPSSGKVLRARLHQLHLERASVAAWIEVVT